MREIISVSDQKSKREVVEWGSQKSNTDTVSAGRRFQIRAKVTDRNLLMPENAVHGWQGHSLTCHGGQGWPHQQTPQNYELLCESGCCPLHPLSFSELTQDSCATNLVKSKS